MTHDEMITVIAAHRDGKQIQVREIDLRHKRALWVDVGGGPLLWDFGYWEYRIKPSPPGPRHYFVRLNRFGDIPSRGVAVSRDANLLMESDWDDGDKIIQVIEVLPSSGEEKA